MLVIGSSVALSWTPGVAGTATVAVRLPDGTTLTPAPTVTTTGSGGAVVHTAAFTTTQAGRHLVSWTSGTTKLVDIADVWPADPRFLISIDDALDAIKAGAGAPASTRDDMPLYVAAASLAIEDLCGPLISESRTLTTNGGRPSIVLPATNVTVTSVTVNGSALAAASYDVDKGAGVIWSPCLTPGVGNVVVVYTVGSMTLPANLRLACREQVRFLWQTTRQGTGRAAQELGYTPSGYAVPYMVAGLCAAHPGAHGTA